MGAFWVTSAFVFWLISFPMGGFLLKGERDFLFFLLSHTAGLFLTGFFLKRKAFEMLLPPAVAVVCVLTALYPFVDYRSLLMIPTGLVSALISVNMGVFLKSHVNFFDPRSLWVLGGVALGNAGTLALNLSPVPAEAKYVVLSLALASSLLWRLERGVFLNSTGINLLDTAFIFALYLSGGIMYGRIHPLYHQSFGAEVLEVIFYILSVCVAIFLLYRQNTYVWVLKITTVVLIGLAFVLMHITSPLTLGASMFLLQGGFGFADLYVLVLLLKYTDPVRAFGVGFGIVCTSILTGSILSSASLPSSVLSALGTLSLIVTAVTLMMTRYMRSSRSIPSHRPTAALTEEEKTARVDRLSSREKEVLALLLQNRSYRDIARELGLSVSTVREYVRRICTKLEMDREEIVEVFRNSPPL